MVTESFLVVGLGNPGERYAGTRHNIGFDCVDILSGKNGGVFSKQKWDAVTARISSGGKDIHLVKPHTFMNRSGISVVRFVDFYKFPLDHVLVIHDDLDMASGRLKLVKGGGAGGHNGIRSLVSSLGENGFFRLKIGIGRPGSWGTPEKMPVDKYVLTPFGSEEQSALKKRLDEAVSGLEMFFTEGPARAMNYLNSFREISDT